MTSPDASEIQRAAELLRSGELVAFPTETVYGLGADASNPAAVRKIFEAKGRPSSHPLIVHLASRREVGRWTDELPRFAERLAEKFWPGPLTLVVRRGPLVSPVVTGGQATVALRVPAHPVALALLLDFAGGVAAPSANRFGALSPTRAEHVRQDLGETVRCVLDGGDCDIGVESTIVDVSSGRAVLLRPGGLTAERMREELGVPLELPTDESVRAPGRLPSHYAPRAELFLVSQLELVDRVDAAIARGARVGVLAPELPNAQGAWVGLLLPRDADAAAHVLYGSLRKLDGRGVDVIFAVPPAALGVGAAVVDRLERAAAPRPSVERA